MPTIDPPGDGKQIDRAIDESVDESARAHSLMMSLNIGRGSAPFPVAWHNILCSAEASLQRALNNVQALRHALQMMEMAARRSREELAMEDDDDGQA